MYESTKEHSVVAIYDSHTDARSAVKALHQAGLDMMRLSMAGKDSATDEHVLGCYTAGDRMRFWGGRGAVWGSLFGMFVGSAFFFIPAVGPLVVMGPLVGWVVNALEGAAVGGAVGVLGAALMSIGIPKDSVEECELEVNRGKFLVLARGPADIIEYARAVLGTTRPAHLAAHAACD